MSDKHEEYVERLDKIQRDLDWIIHFLIHSDRNNSPLYPKLPDYPPPNDYKIPCSLCGKVWERIENYYCPNLSCPIQRKVTS